MLVLGLSGSLCRIHEYRKELKEGNFHDAAAALIHNGRVVAAFEEERLNRIKHTNKLPVMAVKACLESCGYSFEQIDFFSFSESTESMRVMLKELGADLGNNTPQQFLHALFENEFQVRVDPHRFEFVDHHHAHAVTAFYPSSFEKSLVLTIDGLGGSYTGAVYEGNNNQLSLLHTFSFEQSLGLFYSNVTFMLGLGYFDEYKVMGLAPYGNPDTYRKLFEKFYTLLPGGNYILHTHEFAKVQSLCPPANKQSGFTQVHMDIAAALQETLEKIVFHIVKHFLQVTGHSNLCLAGGVALNCTMNGKLASSGLVKDIFVYPAANDSGLPVGSALATYFKHRPNAARRPLEHLYLGSDIGNNDFIAEALGDWKNLLEYEKVQDPSLKAAELLADGNVIGWVQGRSEFAPRALGNRSILADARPSGNKDRINLIVKKREGYRPFAPSVLEEEAAEYFDLPPNCRSLPYMMFVISVREKYRSLLGAVTHVDGTARVQTVSKEDNLKYWQLIRFFKEKTGTPVVLNTSFNNNVEPIVDSVDDAVVCFLTTELNYLMIGDYLITKKEDLLKGMEGLYLSLPPYVRLERSECRIWLNEWKVKEIFEAKTTFNEKKIDLSRALFDLLSMSNGRKTIRALMQECTTGNNVVNKGKLIGELADLWNRRMIRLTPAVKLSENVPLLQNKI